MANEQNIAKNKFVKGDPRINRKGRPKDFDALRDLARSIGNEPAYTRDDEPVIIHGHHATINEIVLRSWAQSRNPLLAIKFMEIEFGKVPDKVDNTNLNVDFTKLTEDQLKRISEGEDVRDVLSS